MQSYSNMQLQVATHTNEVILITKFGNWKGICEEDYVHMKSKKPNSLEQRSAMAHVKIATLSTLWSLVEVKTWKYYILKQGRKLHVMHV